MPPPGTARAARRRSRASENLVDVLTRRPAEPLASIAVVEQAARWRPRAPSGSCCGTDEPGPPVDDGLGETVDGGGDDRHPEPPSPRAPTSAGRRGRRSRPRRTAGEDRGAPVAPDDLLVRAGRRGSRRRAQPRGGRSSSAPQRARRRRPRAGRGRLARRRRPHAATRSSRPFFSTRRATVSTTSGCRRLARRARRAGEVDGVGTTSHAAVVRRATASR